MKLLEEGGQGGKLHLTASQDNLFPQGSFCGRTAGLLQGRGAARWSSEHPKGQAAPGLCLPPFILPVSLSSHFHLHSFGYHGWLTPTPLWHPQDLIPLPKVGWGESSSPCPDGFGPSDSAHICEGLQREGAGPGFCFLMGGGRFPSLASEAPGCWSQGQSRHPKRARGRAKSRI